MTAAALRRETRAVVIGASFAVVLGASVPAHADDAAPRASADTGERPPAAAESPAAASSALPRPPAAGTESPAVGDAGEPTPPATAAGKAAAVDAGELAPPAAPAGSPAALAAGEHDKKRVKKEKKKRRSAEGVVSADGLEHGRIEVGGRVFARAALARQPRTVVDENGTPVEEDVNSLDMSVPSARLHAKYRAPMKWLSAEVEADFAGSPELKDAYLRARPDHVSAQAGQFKMPFSAIRLESPWDLPVADRGFVDEVLIDRFQIAGRRPGWAFGVRDKHGIRPEVVVGTFQGSVLEDASTGDFDPIDELTLDSQSLAARATIRVGDIDLGAAYEHRVGSPAELEVEHYATGNLDAVIDTPIGGGGLRVWAEGIGGESWYEHDEKPADGSDAIFVCLRLIAAFRFSGASYAAPYVEPYGMLAGLDPDVEVTSDTVMAGAIGVNVGLWDLVRIGLQGEVVRVARNFPRSVYLGRQLDRTALVLQAGIEL